VREYLLCLVIAAAVTYLTTPVARALALRWGVMAEVRDRDVHDEPTPRMGGLAMAAGLVAALLLARQLPLMSSVFHGSSEPKALLLAAGKRQVGIGCADEICRPSPCRGCHGDAGNRDRVAADRRNVRS